MAASSKSTAMAKDRRKSGKTNGSTDARRSTSPEPGSDKPTLTVTLNVPSDKLRAIVDPESLVKEETPTPKDAKDSPATSATLPAAPVSSAENASDSNPATPAASGTPAPQPMGPPTEGPKKKGVKRSAGAAGANGEPKARGKPGPKKKQRLDDGTIEGGKANGLGAGHRLGPKANQGAINAGLRALDRSGKPCRKWAKGGFKLKSFTGTVWEIPRWTAPPKPEPEPVVTEESASASAAVSAAGSSKENKEDKENKENKENGENDTNGVNSVNDTNDANGTDGPAAKSDVASNRDADVEIQSVHSAVAENSPAPMTIAVA